MYRVKGYDEEWIIKRIKNIQDRKKLTDVWKDNGVYSDIEFFLFNEMNKNRSVLIQNTDYVLYKKIFHIVNKKKMHFILKILK